MVGLSALLPEISPVLISLRIYFGLVYVIMIHAIVSAVFDQIARGQEALEAIEEQDRSAQDAARQEELRSILANIPPTDYVLMRRS